MPNRGMAALVSVFALITACTPNPPAASPAPSASADNGANWLTYNRTLAGDRYSPLAQIDRSNVAQLRNICTYTLPR